jgi:hypothetical protein
MKNAITAGLALLWLSDILNERQAASIENAIPGYVARRRKRRPRCHYIQS